MKEAHKYMKSRKPRTIVISFVNDPYQPREIVEEKTRRTLEILLFSKVNHKIMILTKNPFLALDRDFDLLKRGNIWLGTTITSLQRIPDEPNAPPNSERIEVLRKAHLDGIHTWISLEPWIPYITDPIEIINHTHEFVDFYVIGRLNYAKQLGYNNISDDFYRKMLPDVISLLKKTR
jgi:DNA repair photolyase